MRRKIITGPPKERLHDCQQAYKGSGIVIQNREDYLKEAYNLINDTNNYLPLNYDPTDEFLRRYSQDKTEGYKDLFLQYVNKNMNLQFTMNHDKRRTLKNGTTTACYFTTIHTDASLLLADLTNHYGQRAFIGKVCMYSNTTYPKYIESTEQSVEETERFVEALKSKNYARVKPIVTPRFGISCSEKLLMELGKLAELHIQSHISESTAEIEEVLRLFPAYDTYTEVFSKNKLLTNKTVMAHGCYLTDDELAVFRTKGAALSHCPNSNISLCSGHLDVQNVIVKLGLGTDVAGGYSVSMLDATRKAIETSKILFIERQKRKQKSKKIDKNHNEVDGETEVISVSNGIKEKENGFKVLSNEEAFRLATLGGSEALNIDHITGNFEVCKEFDALLINPEAEDSPFEILPNTSTEELVERFIYLGDDRNIKAVYVAGRCVVPF
ncbi:LOW QUALITY PROTEIN: guanine deaminase [Discoglossus pictus]